MRKRSPRAPTYTLHTLRKGLEVLEALEASRDDLTLTEVAARVGEARTVVFRQLRTLEECGYVQQDPSTKRYRLGLRVWELGCKAIGRTGLIDLARPVLKWLTEVTAETSALVMLRGLFVKVSG
jgi:IclR family pca regulon transcriptional regulator